MCGAFEDVREECLASAGLIDQAILWFLSSGSADPSLTWLDFLDSVRSV